MGRPLTTIIAEMAFGPADSEPVRLAYTRWGPGVADEANAHADLLEQLSAVATVIASVLGTPVSRRHAWFEAVAPGLLGGVAWLVKDRYLLLLVEPREEAAAAMSLYAITEDDMDADDSPPPASVH